MVIQERLSLNSNMPFYILKLGGSVITEKDKDVLKIRDGVVLRLAVEIKNALKEGEFNLIIVHGAGPYGHKLVTEYGIKDGLKSESDFEAFKRVQESVKFLNSKVVSIFNKAGIDLIPVYPHEVIVQKNKKIKEFDINPVKEILKQNKIPVLYGDMVTDTELGGSVVSGDAIVAYLGGKLNPDLILLGTDVDGIFDTDPKIDPSAKLIPVITRDNFAEILERVGESRSSDVTMGMKGKLISLKEMCDGRKAIVFSALKEGNLESLLKGDSVVCTIIDMKG